MRNRSALPSPDLGLKNSTGFDGGRAAGRCSMAAERGSHDHKRRQNRDDDPDRNQRIAAEQRGPATRTERKPPRVRGRPPESRHGATSPCQAAPSTSTRQPATISPRGSSRPRRPGPGRSPLPPARPPAPRLASARHLLSLFRTAETLPSRSRAMHVSAEQRPRASSPC